MISRHKNKKQAIIKEVKKTLKNSKIDIRKDGQKKKKRGIEKR